MRTRLLTATVGFSAALVGLAAGDTPGELTAVPNRPTASTTAESIASGVFEVEAGFAAARGNENVNTLLKLGLRDTLELWIAPNPFERDELAGSGLGDTSVGFKLRFVSQKGRVPSIGILYLAKLPTAGGSLGSGKVDHAVTLLASKDYGKDHVDANAGVELLGRDFPSGFDHDLFWALTWSYPNGGKLGVAAEASGFSGANATSTVSLLAAVTYSTKPRLVLDAALSVAAHGDLPRVTVQAGLTYSVLRYHH